jgi:hypothetical protein
MASRNYKNSGHNEFTNSTFNASVTFGESKHIRTLKTMQDLVPKISWDILSHHLSVTNQDEYRSTISPLDRDEPSRFWITRNIDYTQWESPHGRKPKVLLLSAPHGHGTTEICSYVIEAASRTKGSVLYFFCSSATSARQSTILTYTLLDQVVRCSDYGKADSIAAAFISTLVFRHFQRRPKDFREEDPLDVTVEKILGALDEELIEALAEAIKKAGFQELSIIVDGLQEDIACWLAPLIMEAAPELRVLLTSKHSFGKIPNRVAYIEYDKERKECLGFLRHDDTRYGKIEEAHHDSLEFLWRHPQYLKWLASTTSSILYIEGKPGCGKSTLTKYFERNLAKRVPNVSSCTVAYYFYSVRGTDLERTHVNMLRSLLRSILEQDESTFFHFQPEFRAFRHRGLSQWPYDSLKKVLSSLANHPPTKPLYLIIDAMDESDEEDRRNIVQLLCELCSEKNPCKIKIFLASRPLPVLELRIKKFHPVIRMQDENKDAIFKYTDHFLSSDIELTGEIFNEARDYIMENAQGVFVWVALIKKKLQDLVERGYSGTDILKTLKNLPPELEEFYTYMFGKLEIGRGDIVIGIRLFHFILFAFRPLTVEELSDVLAMPDDRTPSYKEFCANKIQGINRRIEHCGGGFLEIKEDATVQFIHKTARDFVVQTLESKPKFDTSGEEVNKMFPLMAYALRYIIDHRDCCSKKKRLVESISELVTTLINQLISNPATYFLGAFIDFHDSSSVISTNVLKLASGTTRLTIDTKYQATSEDIEYKTLDAAAEPNLPHACKTLLLTCTQDDGQDKGKTPLIISVQKGLLAATRLLLDGYVDKDASDSSGQTALHYAVQNSDEPMVCLLIRGGVRKDVKDHEGMVALQRAVEKFPFDNKGRKIYLDYRDDTLPPIVRLLCKRQPSEKAED